MPQTGGQHPDYIQSSEKKNAYIRRCPPPDRPLFPLDLPPQSWPSCHDAYEVTWALDTGKHLVGLPETERLKLSRSMGFCPHLRCQLGDVGNANSHGSCPPGLCYTKVEAGAPTFGACCFSDGVFNSGSILGYYRLLRATPKPIYKRNRVVLGPDPHDESAAAFINANEVSPGLIIAQCPIVDSSEEADATLPSAERMMAEQGVQLVIQLDPFLPTDDEAVTQAQLLSLTSKRGCGVWPAQAGYADLTVVRHEPRHCLMEFRYTLPSEQGTEVRHLWYYCWRDFSVPRPRDRGPIRETAQLAAQVMDQGGKVMLTCHAGRGRSGTLAAVIVGLQRGLGTHGDLVDAIVAMRESRDGLVETPEQYAFVRDLLGIAAPVAWIDRPLVLYSLGLFLLVFLATSAGLWKKLDPPKGMREPTKKKK